jgi:hypothetical protein
MKRFLRCTALGLGLLPLAGLLSAAELSGGGAAPVATARPQPQPAPKPAEKGCGSHGTRIDFVDTPTKAAKIAKKEQKLVFVLHVSGNFEDPRFT